MYEFLPLLMEKPLAPTYELTVHIQGHAVETQLGFTNLDKTLKSAVVSLSQQNGSTDGYSKSNKAR